MNPFSRLKTWFARRRLRAQRKLWNTLSETFYEQPSSVTHIWVGDGVAPDPCVTYAAYTIGRVEVYWGEHCYGVPPEGTEPEYSVERDRCGRVRTICLRYARPEDEK